MPKKVLSLAPAAGWHRGSKQFCARRLAGGRGITQTTDLLTHENIKFLALDLQDVDACAAACRDLNGITHIVYTAVYELPGLVNGWADPHQIETNGQMLKNLLRALDNCSHLEHITLLQGTKAYGAMVGPMRVPARETSLASITLTFIGCRKTFCAPMPSSATTASPYFGRK